MPYSIPKWILNCDYDKITRSEIERQIDGIQKSDHYDGVMVTIWGRDGYLSEKFFSVYKTILEVLTERNMKCIIWDENRYPSGVFGANLDKKYRSHTIKMYEYDEYMSKPELSAHLIGAVIIRSDKSRIDVTAELAAQGNILVESGSRLIVFTCENDIHGSVIGYSGANTQCCLSQHYVSYKNKTLTGQMGPTYYFDCQKTDHSISSAIVRKEYYTKTLYKRPVEKLKLSCERAGKLIEKEKRLYDLGCETVGFLNIIFRAPKGSLVEVCFGEHIEDGEVRRVIGNRDFSVNLIANGELIEFKGTFRRLGCRYLQVFCSQETVIEYIGITETTYPLKRARFNAGSTIRQEIYDTAVKTLELCLHEHYEDCPWREQAMYVMDSRNQMLCGYYAFEGGNFEFARANLLLMSKAQKSDKLLPLCFPAGLDAPIPYFSLMYVVSMQEYAEHSGDLSLCRDNIKLLEDIIEAFAARLSDNNLIPTLQGYWNFYEWSDGLSGATPAANPIFAEKSEFDVVLNSIFLYALQSYIIITEEYLKIKTLNEYRVMIKKMKEGINRIFYNAENGLYRTRQNEEHYSELANSLAVLCGAADKAQTNKICRLLAGDNDIVKATLSMIAFKYDALLLGAYYENDRDKYNSYILSDIEKNYGYMLSHGATSFWETMDGAKAFDGAGSLCHGWSAIPIYYFHKLKEKLKKHI